MNRSSLFEPISIGNVRIKNRLYMAPIHAGLSTGTYGGINDRYIEFYRERAKGGVGLIITGHVKAERAIDPYPRGYGLCLDDKNQLKDYRELTEAVHAHGAKIAVELSAGAGRIADTIADGFIPASPTSMPLLYFPKTSTRELTKDEIGGLVKAYGKAAANAKAAGFDFVMVHAMAYLFDQFLTPAWNQRDDEYGGCLENRMRFMMECIESARAATGPDYPLIASLSMDDGVRNGKAMEDVLACARALEKAGIAALHVRNGGYDRMDLFISSYLTEGPQCIDLAAKVREAVSIPVLSDGSLTTPDACTQAVEGGAVDMAGLARPLIADPQWPRKAQAGSDEAIRPCLRCMECLTRVGAGWRVGCAVNPLAGREIEAPIPPARERKKVVVVGGGTSGMLAAMHARERGHDVTLVEEGAQLGGRLLTASQPGFKVDARRYLGYLKRRIDELDIDVRLKTKATADLISQMGPDEVILATESADARPQITGVASANVLQAAEALSSPSRVESPVVVVGSGFSGCEAALELGRRGHEVTLVDGQRRIGANVPFFVRVEMLSSLASCGATLKPSSKVRAIADEGVTLETAEGSEAVVASTVVFATGGKASNPVHEELARAFPRAHVIGDAAGTYGYLDACREALAVSSII